jgi:phosphatidylinositol alpha 1,6-mannosyltransferase
MFTGANETFGQVVQEAMASGLPAIVIDQGGVTDLVTVGVNGFICPSDAEAFAAAARTLRDQPDLRRQMSINARRSTEARTWEAIMAELEGHYTEAISLNARFSQRYPMDARFNLLSWKNTLRRVN